MTSLVLKAFRGEVPRLSDRLLDSNQATQSVDAKLWSGELRAWRAPLRVNNPTKAVTKKSIYRWGATPGADDDGLITGVSTANPTVITSASHGRTTGDRVFISATGVATIDDKTHTITVIDANTFSLDGVDGTGFSYTSGGHWFFENGYWFHWGTDVDAVKGPIAGDTVERTYFTGDGSYPKFTKSPNAVTGGTDYPMADFRLGIPAPATAPSAQLAAAKTGTVTGITLTSGFPVKITSTAHSLYTGYKVTFASVGGTTELNGNQYTITRVDANTFTLDNTDGANFTAWTSGGTWTQVCDVADQVSRHYVYTYVSPDGEEGLPSAPSGVISACPGQNISIADMATDPGGAYNLGSTATKRIYRTVSGSETFQFLAEVPITQTTYTDTKDDTELGEILPSVDWDEPPTDLHSIRMMPNGIAVAASKNEVCFSEPWQPHAWPIKYRLATDRDIVTVETFGTSVAVLTEGYPYLITGADLPTMTMEKLSSQQTCVSKRSVATWEGLGVVYASPDGLVSVGYDGVQVITENFLTRDEWQALKPSSILGFVVEGRYIGFYDNGTTQGGFIFDPAEGRAGWTQISTFATGGFYDILSDSLFLIINNYIERWDGGVRAGQTKQSYTWTSKKFQSPDPINLGVGQVFAKSYSDLTLEYFADGVSKKRIAVKSSAEFRLPGGFLADQHQVKLTGTDSVETVMLAESSEELRALG